MSNRIDELLQSLDKEDSKKMTYRCDTMSILSVFLDRPPTDGKFKVTPSCYMDEMAKTTEDRYAYLTNPLTSCSFRDLEPPRSKTFRCTPEVIVFQNCAVGCHSSVTLSVRNTTQVIKPLRMHFEHGKCFDVSYTSKVLRKLAFGMSVKFTVTFTPDKKKDYKFEISFESDSEHFSVPVYALGPRQLLDIPDEIHFPVTLVKVLSTKMVTVRNVGDIDAVANLTVTKPFDVSPKNLYLKVNESAYVTVSYRPTSKGSHCCDLKILYETGEELSGRVCGAAEDGDIYLKNDWIQMRNTHVGLKQWEKVIINNGTDTVVNFRWQAFRSVQEDERQLKKIYDLFDTYKSAEVLKTARIKYHDFVDTEVHRLIYERILNDEKNSTGSEDLTYHHPNFEIIPISGKIWPKSQSEVTIVFSPLEPVEYVTTAYCEVEGLEDRVEVRVTGVGRGPNICLNVDSVDFNYIFLCTPRSYEIIVKNDGDIPGHITYVPTKMIFGSRIGCEPVSHYLLPNQYKTFVLTISSNKVGQFVEDVLFLIEESGQKLKCVFKGKIVGPLLHFDTKLLDFGNVPLGFPIVRTVFLRNSSEVSAKFSLSVLNDGGEQPVTCWQFARDPVQSPLPTSPKDFTLIPSSGTIGPSSYIHIKVRLLPNLCRAHSSCIQIRVHGVLFDEASLRVRYASKHSEIVCHPSEIISRFSFINYEYLFSLNFENRSNLPAFFFVIPDQYDERELSLSLSVRQGILMSKSVTTINVSAITRTLKKQVVCINLLRFGDSVVTVVSKMVLEGRGPFVTPSLYSLSWGDVTLLEPTTRRITLSNICPIPAVFTCVIDKDPTLWSVWPTEGTLMPGGALDLALTATLVDAGVKTETMTIKITYGQPMTIPLSACGYGSSIVVEPAICPVYDMGHVFRKYSIEIPLKITNRGTRYHQVLWITSKEIKSLTRRLYEKMQGKYFQLEPYKLELEGGETKEITLKVRCDAIMEVEQIYYCFGVVEHKGKRILLSESLLKASFVDPKIEFAVPQLDFHCDIPPTCTEVKPLRKNLPMSSKLDVSVMLIIDRPFKMLTDGCAPQSELSMEMQRNVTYTIGVQFDPLSGDDMHSRVVKGHLHVYYKGLSHKDAFPITSEINFPCVRLSKKEINFGYVDPCTESYCEISMTNVSPFVVDYCWRWCDDSIEISSPRSSCSDDASCEVLSAPSTILDGCDTRTESEVTIAEEILCPELEAHTDGTDVKESDDGLPLNFFEEIRAEEQEARCIRDSVLPLVSSFVTQNHLAPALNLLPQANSITPINRLVVITPNGGKIPPHQEAVVSVSFRPEREMSLRASAVCRITGGPDEIVKFSGECSRLKFKFSSKSIDFGYKRFCEIWKEKFSLLNNGGLRFNYAVKINDEDKYDACKWKPFGLSVIPESGTLEPNKSVEFLVKFYPGKIGVIDRYFFVEVGLSNPITVRLRGCAVVPQIYVDLKDCPLDSESLPENVLYQTLSHLTSDWFYSEEARPETPPSCSAICMGEPSSVYKNKWEYEYVNIEECQFPQHHHLRLGLERELINNYVEWFPTYLQVHSLVEEAKDGPLHKFVAPGYVLDFGYVISDTDAEASIALINCGYLVADVKLVLPLVNKVLNSMGLVFRFPDKGQPLSIGQTFYIYVTFKPTSQTYPERLQVVDLKFQLEISCGPTIPISLTASVTYPFLTLQPEVDFGDVKCGNCKIIAIPIKNEGYVACEWVARVKNIPRAPLKKTKGKGQGVHSNNNLPPPFTLDISSGFYEPKTIGLVKISFQPMSDGQVESSLEFEIQFSKETQTIVLKGNGIEPQVVVEDLLYDFGTVEPYSGVCERKLTVTNPCPFPVEIFFPDYDSQYEQEQRILSAVTRLYSTEEVLLPLKYYDVVMTQELFSFYDELAKLAATKYLLSQELSNELTVSGSTLSSSSSRKKSAQIRLSRKSRSASVASVNATSFLSEKTSIEIDSLVHDYIDWTYENSEESIFDPFGRNNSKTSFATETRAEDNGEQTLIVFHGSPLTDYVYWANHTARSMNLSAVSLDQIILEEAAQSTSPSAVRIRSAINAGYAQFIMEISPVEHPQPDQLASDSCISDPLEDLKGKVEALERFQTLNGYLGAVETDAEQKADGSGGSKKGTKEKGTKKGSSKGSKKGGSTEKDNGDSDTFLQVSIEDIADLVTPRLEDMMKKRGVVVDSLSGLFIRSRWLALFMLLKIAGTSKNVHFVVLNNTTEHYRRLMDFNKKVQEMERVKICHDIDGMNSDEYANLPDSLKQLYRRELVRRESALDRFESERNAALKAEELRKAKEEKDNKKSPKGKKPKSEKSPKAEKSAAKTAVSKGGTATTKGSKKAQSKGTAGGKSPKKKKETEAEPESMDEEKMLQSLETFQSELIDILSFLENFNQFQPVFEMPVAESAPSNKKESKVSGGKKSSKKAGASQKSAPNDSLTQLQTGIPVWLIDKQNVDEIDLSTIRECDLPNLNLKMEAYEVSAQMEALPQIIGIKYTEPEPLPWDHVDVPEPDILFSVTQPSRRTKDETTKAFILMDPPVAVNTLLFESSLIELGEDLGESAEGMTPKNRPYEYEDVSQSKEELKEYYNTKEFLALGANFKKRCVLKPGDSVNWRLLYHPEPCRKSEQFFTIQVGGWERSAYRIRCVGISELPFIVQDPSVIFPKVVDTLSSELIKEPVFVLDKKTLYFKTILFCKLNKEERAKEKPCRLKFQNATELEIEITFSFKKDFNKKKLGGFAFEPTFMKLGPKCSDFLSIQTFPNSPGTAEEVLVYSIRNNPAAGSIKLHYTSVKGEVKMEPHLIRFDRILLFRKESQSVRLTNECQLPLSWRFVNLEKIESKISVAKTEGTLEPYGSDVVYFTYHAQIVEECSREIRLLVYEKSWRGEPVKKLNLKFQIESYDVLIDVQFPDSESTYLNFGLMKIDEKKDKTFELKNLGNRDMLYRIDLENQPNSTVGSSEFLRISPVEGDLHKGSKVVRILVTAKCTEEVELSESSIINVQILTKRSSVEPETVATIPIAVSLKSSFSKFLIHPSLDLNFGCLEVGKKKYLDLTIENAGPFQLSYSIEALNAEDHKPKKPKRPESVPSTRAQTVKSCCCSTSRRGSKSITASKKSKNHQESQRNFQALGDTFSYEKPGKGVIKPSASATIKFESYPKSDKLVKETAQLIVTDPLPATRKPTLIDLSVVGCLPCVNFDDVNSIYREVLIVDDLDGFESDRKREMGLPFVVYSRSLDILDFRNVVIGSSHETRLVLTNTGQVTCKLTAQTDTDINEDEVFVVTPAAFTIEPYTSETVTVCFSPTLLKEVQCLMELILEMPKTIDEVKHSVTLRGSGHVPFVEITKPVITATNEKSFTDISVIDLGLTIVGFPLWKSFAFKNTSPVLCKIMMEILGNGQNYFDFKFEDSTRDLIKLLNPKGGLENSSVLSLGPGTEAEFVVWFPATLPSPGVPSECEVRLHTLYNPYEHLRVCFKAEAHAREVFFEGLDFSFSPDLVKKAGRSSSAQTPSSSVRLHDSVTYTLDFGRSTVGVGAMREFTLVNRSSSAVKFLWAKAADILLYPSAGHMQPLSSKVIYAFFFPHNAIHIQEVHVVCTVHKIVHPVEHRAADLGWDSHREFTEWMSRQNRKELRLEHMLSMVKEDAKEPDYSPIRGETPFSLLVLTSGLANYPQLNFPLEDVPFEETLLCQSQETEIALENVGEIPAHFAWRIQPRTWAPPLDGGGDEGEGESATRMLKGTCSMGRLDVDSLYPAWVSWNDSGDSVPAEGQPETSISEGHLNTLSVPANDQIPTSANICSHKLSDKNSLKKSECEMKGNAEAPSIGGYRCPFSITPESGIVEPKNTLICSLVFNPKQPLSFTADLICSVKNTNLPDFVVSISGIGVMSHCHIEIEETDYLKSKRRGIPGPEHPGLISGPILPETRVIEVRTIGVKHSFRKKFNLLNPTEEAYSYEWINVSESKLNHDLSAFSCPNPSGFIQGRRGVEVTFLFLPMKCGTFESLWTLLIPKFSIQQPVLFVGVTREPSVVTDPVQVNLRPTLCGVKTGGYFSLINREEMCLKYRIEECSLSCEEKYNCLDVEPMTGVLKAKSETPFRISYEPKRPGEVCFVVKCKVQKTDEPLSLKVCAKCFEVQPIVSYDLDGKGRRDLHSLSTNYIDLGQLTPRIPKVVNFYVTNVGKAPFYYDCETYPDQCQNGGVAIDCTNKKRELVTAQLRSNIALAVTALEKTQFDDIPFKIRITKGPEYEIKFRGNALVPAFKFSFSEYNFGLCLIQTSDTGYNTTTLCFSNVDESSILIENVTPENKNFCVDLTTADVPPKTELEITITFCPRNNAECKERLQFLINGLYKHCIDVKGEGFYLSLSLANVADQLIDMGPVLVGKVAKRTVEVVNNSLGAIRLCFIRTDSVRVQPDEGIKVGRKKSTKLVVEYSPRERGQTIFDKVYYKCQDVEEPLLIVKGYGIGPDFTLDKTVLPFGATVVGCLNTLKVALSNRGDIGSRYSWDLGSASKYFTVKPPDGYSSPGSECVFEVSFYPDRIMKMVKNKVTCHLEGSSLDLTLTGTSVDLSSPTEMIDFKCPVRSSDLKAVAIDNATDELWVVHPILSGDYFTGDEVVKILPNTTGEYHIRYTPQTMTGGSAHTGSALFAYPDGTCAVYSLSGVADPPFPVDTLNWEFPCKSNYTATLELANWLQIPQRFSVEIVLLTKVQSHYIPNYNKHVEVLPHFKRDYNIQLYFYKPCKAVFKVSFTNENSKEYMFYLVNVRITECGSLGTLEMSTRVRCTATRDVFITNPTDEETVVAFLSPLPEVEALNTPLIIEPNSVGQLVLQYSPLVESDAKTVEVRCESRVLGSFPYELRLSALPPLPEEALVISAHFGSRTKTTIPVRNLSAFEANFKIKVNPSDISVQDRVIVPPKNVVSVEVTYEPSDMENHTANITVSSLEAGTFVYPVYATCLPPKPQGPYLLKPSAKAKINFRNVFKGKKTFTWAFDNPAFYSSKSSFVLESKKEAKIEVWMVSKEKMGDLRWEDIAVTGKMVVTATDPNRSNISWVYYLRGELT